MVLVSPFSTISSVLILLLFHGGGGSKLLQNVGNDLPDCTASHSRQQ
jgi:hypothetical protein